MTSLSIVAPARDPRQGRLSLLIAVIALVILIAVGVLSPPAALHGWIIGFCFVGGIPLGALALLLVHGLTGGRWGEAHRPTLLSFATAVPFTIVLVLPLIIGARLAYPWAADPSTAGRGVATLYLNPLSFGLRSVVGLGICGGLAWLAARGRLGLLATGLGLCAYVVFANAAAYDWLLSLAPRFTTSAFGAQVIVGQMLSALCLATLMSRADAEETSWGDLGALMLALTLGESYLILMGMLIDWYGDLPDQAAWYMRRTLHGWAWLEGAGALLGSALPMLALLFARVRDDPVLLRPVALFILTGLLIEEVWLVAPGTEAASGLLGVVAVAAVGGLLVAARPLTALLGGDRNGD